MFYSKGAQNYYCFCIKPRNRKSCNRSQQIDNPKLIKSAKVMIRWNGVTVKSDKDKNLNVPFHDYDSSSDEEMFRKPFSDHHQ